MDLDRMTLNAYLDEWVVLLRTRVQPTTLRSYEDMLDAYIRPTLGEIPVGELQVRELNLHYVHLMERGGRRGGPLTRRTVLYAHVVLAKALGDAVRDGSLETNVARRATVPRIDPDADAPPPVLRVWDPQQAQRFLELTADDPLHDLWRVALGTGMRRGELLGLRWQDVDLDVPRLRVTTALTLADGRLRLKSTKTGRARVLHLDEATAAAIARQPRYDDLHHPVVFTTPQHTPWVPHHITNVWRQQWPALPLPRIRLHDLRHCRATLLLDQQVPVKVVSERLGHRTIAMTMDLYAHVLPAQDRDAAAAIGRALGP